VTAPLDALERKLGHDFGNRALLEQALTHRSVSTKSNERLEFLGDAVLSLLIAEVAYRGRPDLPEGDLSRVRAALVRESTLAAIAGELDLGRWLRLGGGELKSGGARRASLLADALEAVVGAIYLDAGLDAARRTIDALYGERLTELPDADSLKDAKTRLQERLQAQARPRPAYTIVDRAGSEHARQFRVQCRLTDSGAVYHGRGPSRRKAEQAAAEAMLESFAEER